MEEPPASARVDHRPVTPPRASPGTPLYVHVPFCVQKCSYCDFYSLAGTPEDADGVVDGLLAEARWRAPSRPRTVFLGGGTPSMLTVPALERLLDGLHEITAFRDSATEVSLESNPESLDAPKAASLRALGVHRLTIGVQSLRPETLRLFGRAHTADEGLEAVGIALAAGFTSVGVDLIYGSPGQRLSAWEEDLARILELEVHHVSAYCLTFEEKTPLATWLAEGRVAGLGEEEELAFFHRTRHLLAAAGFPPYEVSNFASSRHHCAHNINYWQNGEHVGIGPSASSKLGQERRGNHRSLRGWLASVTQDSCAPAWRETLAPRRRLGETWWLGLRMTRGVRPEEARRTAGFGPGANAIADLEEDPAEALARELAREGWLEMEDGRYRLGERALPLGDAIASRFLVSPAQVSDPRPTSRP